MADPADQTDDPLEELFAAPDRPVTPRAAFAERLRRRLETELEDLMSPEPSTSPTPSEHPTPDGTITPVDRLDPALVNPGSLFYFTLPGPDVDRSARFYRAVFGWDLHGGTHGYHVDGVYPPMGLASNDSRDPEVWIEVTDIDAAVARVRELGGTAADPSRGDSGWSAYRELFGWEYSPPGEQGGIHITNRLPDGGLGGGRQGTAAELFFRVRDLEASTEAVRAAGGTADPVGEGAEGRHAVCADDQGVPFGLSQPAPGF
jgi:predicted enzyme related to lactoylglutathione lyase